MRLVVAICLAPLLGCTDPGAVFDFPPSPGLTTGTVAVLPAFALQGVPPEGDHTSGIERTLIELGYRVVPAGSAEVRLRAAGIGLASEMHHAPLPTVRDACGAEAVVYVHVERTANSMLLSSGTVRIRCTVRDTRSGEIRWRRDSDSNEPGGLGPTADMVVAGLIVVPALAANGINWLASMLVQYKAHGG